MFEMQRLLRTAVICLWVRGERGTQAAKGGYVGQVFQSGVSTPALSVLPLLFIKQSPKALSDWAPVFASEKQARSTRLVLC